MIDKNELRIGTHFESVKFGTPVMVTAEDISELVLRSDGADINHYIDEMFRPIVLTEDWLIKYGFDYRDGWIDDYYNGRISLCNNPFEEGWAVENINPNFKIQYVHQLETLYFALTGKEMKIKL